MPVTALTVRPYLTVFPATFPWYLVHPAGTRPASTADAVPADEAISTSDTALPPTRNVTAAAGACARMAEPNPAAAAPPHIDGLTWTAFAAGLPVLAADSVPYSPTADRSDRRDPVDPGQQRAAQLRRAEQPGRRGAAARRRTARRRGPAASAAASQARHSDRHEPPDQNSPPATVPHPHLRHGHSGKHDFSA